MTIAVGAMFVAGGLAIANHGGRILTEALESATWPSVKGTVVSASVEEVEDVEMSDGILYMANIEYSYTVDGTSYSSTVISRSGLDGTQSGANELVGRYAKGTVVDVFYDPAAPDAAVLEAGASASAYVGLGFGALFAAVGAACVFVGLRKMKKQAAVA